MGSVRLSSWLGSWLGSAAGGLWQQNPDTTKAQLRNYLANSGAAWKFVVGHHPIASFGSHCKFKMSGDCERMSWLESELQVRLTPHKVHSVQSWDRVRWMVEEHSSVCSTASTTSRAAATAHWHAVLV